MTMTELLKTIDPEEYRFSNMEKFFSAAKELSSEAMDLDNSGSDSLLILNGKIHSSPAIKGLSIAENDGLIEIKLEKNVLLEHALKIRLVSSESNTSEPKVKVKTGSNSKLCLIEEVSGKALSQISFELDAGARVEHLQMNSGALFVHSDSLATLAKDANYRNFIFNLEGGFTRRNTETRLLESGAHAESYCLYLVNGSEHSDIFTKIEHLSPDTTSEQLAKGILGDTSKGIFTGKIHIHPDAQRVYSSQLNKNLLLSKKAQAHSQPQLEIFADDVKCSHGSTTGQLSDDEIFYLESRGIPHEKARTLLSWAFAMEIV